MARAAVTAVAVSAVRRSPRLRTAGTASAATVAVSPAPLAAPKRRGRPKKKPEATTTQDTSSAAAAEEEGDAIKFPHGTLPRTFEEKKVAAGFKCVVGVDEAGRGPLAGPVVAAACHVPLDVHIPGVHDSKKLSEPQREALFAALTSHPRIRYAVHINSPQRIDEINILQASLESMTEAVMALSGPGPAADFVFVDGNRLPKQLTVEAEPVIKGDSKVFAIAAASIIAKVTRDRIMVEYDAQFPQYGLKQHKGYPTAAHMAAIALHGPCAIHRMTFAPLKPKEPKSKTKRPAKATKTTTIKKAKITKAKITSA